MTVALCAQAQSYGVIRGGCTPSVSSNSTGARASGIVSRRALPAIRTQWDANKIYKQLVILVSYTDVDFLSEDPRTFYDQILNTPGYNLGLGEGSMADYFRDQSGGLFNLQCDVYGPFKVSTKAQPYSNPTSSTVNYPKAVQKEATELMFAAYPQLDYKQYDWDGDGTIEQVVYIFAGYSGNQGKGSYGYVWPNTSSMSAITTPDGAKISNYSSSAELWLDNTSQGIGTICHEYSHSLGLPDIYPTGGSSTYYSVCDEWDLMDGGNFTNMGWCPPNYSAMEKMLLGWITPIELSEAATITDMKPMSEGGAVYIIHHTDDEYYLLENRQFLGWDKGLPGRGLLISHVDYSESVWRQNAVNNTAGHFRYDFLHADNLDYEDWEKIQPRSDNRQWDEHMMHNKHLSTTPYPWKTDSTTFVNDALTDTSTPASVMYNKNAAGSELLSKAITNITMSAEGLISFDLMGGTTAIRTLETVSPRQYYDLSGRPIGMPQRGHLYIVRQSNGTIRKQIF